MGSISHALLLPLSNPGFEAYVLDDGDYLTSPSALPGWGVSDKAGAWNPTASNFSGEAPEGNNVAYINSGLIGQWLPTVINEGYHYTMEMKIGIRSDVAYINPEYGLSFVAKNPLTGKAEVVDQFSGVPTTGAFSLVSYSYTATDPSVFGRELGIWLISKSGQISFDDVKVYNSSSVPDASIMWLLGTGIILLGVLNKKKTGM